MRSVRVSCQTIALCTGVPVLRFQTTAVSRWLVTPTAARSDVDRLPFSRAPCTTSCVRSQISVGECSTQPGCGKICSCSF